jgi:predicted ester cyclase
MSDQENIRIAEQQIAALNARDLSVYLLRIDPSYIGESEIVPEPIRGPEGVRRMLDMVFAAFPDLRIESEQILASGDHVISQLRFTATHKGPYQGIAPTNPAVKWRACNVVELRNGKAIRGRLYADNASLLQQLGAISMPRATAAG